MAESPPGAAPTYSVGGLTLDAFLAVNMFLVRHLVRLYAAFDGDLIEAIVLGEVAHHNLSAYSARAQKARHENAIKPHMPERSNCFPTNAYSIAQATGIPRQTVRRKVEALVSRGWLEQRRDGSLVVTAAPFAHFRDFNKELAEDVLSTLNTVIRLNEV